LGMICVGGGGVVPLSDKSDKSDRSDESDRSDNQ